MVYELRVGHVNLRGHTTGVNRNALPLFFQYAEAQNVQIINDNSWKITLTQGFKIKESLNAG